MDKVIIKNITGASIPVTLLHRGYCNRVGRCFCDRIKKTPASVMIGPGEKREFYEAVLSLLSNTGYKDGKQIAVIKVKEEAARSEEQQDQNANANPGTDDSVSVAQTDAADADNTSKDKGKSSNRRSRGSQGKRKKS